ncbi:unnamed protein product [marine sediment metagenome]|uniref:Uncharacterized protein n=1 Tax=marine sediment metagenome TaxID=412755 RepID=X1R9V0_9ZZZZ
MFVFSLALENGQGVDGGAVENELVLLELHELTYSAAGIEYQQRHRVITMMDTGRCCVAWRLLQMAEQFVAFVWRQCVEL